MDSFIELIFIQLVYIVILFFIIPTTILQRRKAIFYWFISGFYMLTIAWLVKELVNVPKAGNGGYGFAIGMYSIIVPGILHF